MRSEYNSGKSSFLNALLGGDYCKTGVLPTTDKICILRYSPAASPSPSSSSSSPPSQLPTAHVDDPSSPDIQSLYLPVAWLQHISVVDTPGTNAIIVGHEALTSSFIPRADCIVFLTSVERPFSESERVFMQRIRQWGKRLLCVLNKHDLLDSEQDREAIVRFVSENVKRELGEDVPVFTVSARQANAARPVAAPASGMPQVENFLFQKLTATEKMRLKLSSPVGVAARLLAEYGARLTAREEKGEEDARLLAEMEREIGLWEREVRKEAELQMEKVERSLYQRMDAAQQTVGAAATMSNVSTSCQNRSRREGTACAATRCRLTASSLRCLLHSAAPQLLGLLRSELNARLDRAVFDGLADGQRYAAHLSLGGHQLATGCLSLCQHCLAVSDSELQDGLSGLIDVMNERTQATFSSINGLIHRRNAQLARRAAAARSDSASTPTPSVSPPSSSLSSPAAAAKDGALQLPVLELSSLSSSTPSHQQFLQLQHEMQTQLSPAFRASFCSSSQSELSFASNLTLAIQASSLSLLGLYLSSVLPALAAPFTYAPPVAAAVLALSSLYFVPSSASRAVRRQRQQLDDVRLALRSAMDRHVERVVDERRRRLLAARGGIERRVGGERDELQDIKRGLEEAQRDVSEIRDMIRLAQ